MATAGSLDLDHFVVAQEQAWPTARAELVAGRKRSHWVWFVFPQLAGLGSSMMAARYGIADVATARAYLEHPVLGARYREAVGIVHEQVVRRGQPLEVLMGSELDAQKLVSSLTLFSGLAGGDPLQADIDDVLAAAARQGFDRCATTTKALAG